MARITIEFEATVIVTKTVEIREGVDSWQAASRYADELEDADFAACQVVEFEDGSPAIRVVSVV